MSSKCESEIKAFRQTKPETLHHQGTFTAKNIKGSSPGKRTSYSKVKILKFREACRAPEIEYVFTKVLFLLFSNILVVKILKQN